MTPTAAFLLGVRWKIPLATLAGGFAVRWLFRWLA